MVEIGATFILIIKDKVVKVCIESLFARATCFEADERIDQSRARAVDRGDVEREYRAVDRDVGVPRGIERNDRRRVYVRVRWRVGDNNGGTVSSRREGGGIDDLRGHQHCLVYISGVD